MSDVSLYAIRNPSELIDVNRFKSIWHENALNVVLTFVSLLLDIWGMKFAYSWLMHTERVILLFVK